MLLLEYWPIFAFTFSLFIGSIGIAIGATLWISGQLTRQDAKRIELKEAVLLEIRQTRHGLYKRMDDAQKDHRDLAIRLTKLETIVASRPWPSHPAI